MAACAAPASLLLRGSERAASDLGRVICGGRRGRADRAPSAATSHRGAGSVHAGPLGLDSQWSSSGLSAAGTGFQAARPQYADVGTSPFADTQDQEVKTLIANLKREMEETRVANSQISLERDEAIARNECLTEKVNRVHKRRAGGRKDLIDSSSPDSRGSPLFVQSANASTNVETLDSVVSEREMFRLEALNNEQRRATAQDTLGNVLLSNG